MRPGPTLLLLALALGPLPAPRLRPVPPPGTPARFPLGAEGAAPSRQVGARAPAPRARPARAPLRAPLIRAPLIRAPLRARPARQVLQPCTIQNLKITSDRGLSPLVLNRKLTATLDGNVRVDCPQAQDRLERWQVLALRSMGDPHRWHRSLKLNLVTGKERWVLLIPSNFLAPGLYAFNFSLSLLSAGRELAKASDRFYITFVRSPLKAVLQGPPNLTISFADPLVLNGSSSSDPDADKNPFDGMQFAWYCSTDAALLQDPLQLTGRDHLCLPEQTSLLWPGPQGSVLALPPRTLRGGGTYFFKMVIQKRSRSASAEKTVQVEPGPPPPTNITCLGNCGQVLMVSEAFSLCANCTQCTPRDAYTWSLASDAGQELPFDWESHTTTGRAGACVSLKAFAFQGLPEAGYRVRVHLSTWGGRTVSLAHAFTVNQPPQAGKCRVRPAEGTSLLTHFVVQCRDFRDKDTPLTYKIIVSDLRGFGTISSLEENTLGAILYLGNASSVATSFLPPGDPANRDSLKLYAQVSDARGAFSQVAFRARVHAPTRAISSAALLEQLGNLTTAPARSAASEVSDRDVEVAGYLFYLVAAMLKDVQLGQEQQSEREKLYEELVSKASLLPLDTAEQIGQVVMLLAKLTEVAEDLPRAIQIQALVRIWQANEALQKHRGDEHFDTEQVEAVCTGVLTTLSNLLHHTSPHEVAEEPLYVLQGLVATVLAGKVPSNETTTLRSASVNIYVRKTPRWNASVLCEEDPAGPACFQPTLTPASVESLPEGSPVSIMFCMFAADPFPWLAAPGPSPVRVAGFRVTGTAPNGDTVDVVPDVTDTLLLRTNLSDGLFPLTVGPDHRSEETGEPGRVTSGAFSFELGGTAQEVLVYILTEVTVLFTASLYAGRTVSEAALVATFLVPPDGPPVANHSDRFDPACPVASAHVLCLSPSLLRLAAERNPEAPAWLVVLLRAPRFVSGPTDQLVNVSVLRLQCLDMAGDYGEWREHTCGLGAHTTWAQVHCVCTARAGHLRARRQLRFFGATGEQLRTHFLSSRVLVAPNFVDLRLEVIKTVPQNPVTLLTVVLVMGLYVAFAFWALHRDETDQFLRDHVIVLPDNDPYDNVCYLLTVFTGSRWGAGTRADVFVQLRGTEGASDAHCLSHPQVKALYRGSIHTFLLTTRSDLGDLRSVRVWHNNEGWAPGWYLSRLKVESLFSRHIWLFLCRTWLSVDTSLDETFSPMPADRRLAPGDYFLIDCVHSLGADHAWFSVFSGVVGNRFDRLQRLSCCLAMLLASLVTNIMFFSLEPEDHEGPVAFQYVETMVIGLQSCLITLPVQLVIAALFVYSQRRPQAELEDVTPQAAPKPSPEAGHWEERLQVWYTEEAAKAQKKSLRKQHAHGALGRAKARRTRLLFRMPESQSPTQPHRNASATSLRDMPHRHSTESLHPDPASRQEKPPIILGSTRLKSAAPPQRKPHFVLPGWCVFLAWFLVFAVSSVSSAFIIFYGLTYGYEKSVEWLLASFCAFCQSVLVVQPLKIILVSGYRTSQPKYAKNLPWTSNYHYMQIQLRPRDLSPEETEALHQDIVALRRSRMYQPLTEDEVRIFQRKQRVRKRALLFLGYVLTHVLFLALLLALVAALGHAGSFHYSRFLRDCFSPGLGAVTELQDVYEWLGRVPVPLFHNEQDPTFLPDSSSKILGLPRLRQVRAEPGKKFCLPAQTLGPGRNRGRVRCHPPESGADREDTRNYSSAWGAVVSTQRADGFLYQPPEAQGAYVSFGVLDAYGSGGYAFYFYPEEQRFNSTLRLADLQRDRWLDGRTRAVVLELTTFSPDAGLLGSLSVLFEVSPLGAVNASLALHSFTLADLDRETSAEAYLYAAVLLFFAAYALDEAYVMGQEGTAYLRSVYNWLNLTLKGLFAVGIALFAWKHVLATRLIRAHVAHPAAFVPFHAVAQLDGAVRVVLGFLIFLSVLKSLRYSRAFYDVRLAQRAIQTAGPAIGHVALIVAVYLLVFMVFGYLVFGQHEWNYSSLAHATQTVCSYCVSAFRSTEFSGGRDGALGLLFLASFLLVMVCVLVKLFQAVILSAYEGLKQPVYEEPSDEAEAVTYLCRKLRAALAFLRCQPEPQYEPEPEFLVGMVYGQPLKKDRRYLGLKTRNISGRRMVYLVV
ncbi:polycystin family receptor for egg jelly [Sorex fumeus]|uniref:polycystin family receptor for egg jelly n=1 Tax=Sorex fumeus TaxID=62283 RepID=UPI0024ACE5E1|nr:polycystin family receptor for egg jelly [Sorex fumeus]